MSAKHKADLPMNKIRTVDITLEHNGPGPKVTATIGPWCDELTARNADKACALAIAHALRKIADEVEAEGVRPEWDHLAFRHGMVG